MCLALTPYEGLGHERDSVFHHELAISAEESRLARGQRLGLVV